MLAGLKVEDLHWDLLIALVVGVVVALGLGSSVPNLLFRTIGDALALDVDLGARPLLVGVALVAVVGLVVGLVGDAPIHEVVRRPDRDALLGREAVQAAAEREAPFAQPGRGRLV
ncbi:MAG: hypothetical protein WCK58_12620, partial [Chloroflexota bacterium]